MFVFQNVHCIHNIFRVPCIHSPPHIHVHMQAYTYKDIEAKSVLMYSAFMLMSYAHDLYGVHVRALKQSLNLH